MVFTRDLGSVLLFFSVVRNFTSSPSSFQPEIISRLLYSFQVFLHHWGNLTLSHLISPCISSSFNLAHENWDFFTKVGFVFKFHQNFSIILVVNDGVSSPLKLWRLFVCNLDHFHGWLFAHSRLRWLRTLNVRQNAQVKFCPLIIACIPWLCCRPWLWPMY